MRMNSGSFDLCWGGSGSRILMPLTDLILANRCLRPRRRLSGNCAISPSRPGPHFRPSVFAVAGSLSKGLCKVLEGIIFRSYRTRQRGRRVRIFECFSEVLHCHRFASHARHKIQGSVSTGMLGHGSGPVVENPSYRSRGSNAKNDIRCTNYCAMLGCFRMINHATLAS